jgi:hypothetical protein
LQLSKAKMYGICVFFSTFFNGLGFLKLGSGSGSASGWKIVYGFAVDHNTAFWSDRKLNPKSDPKKS